MTAEAEKDGPVTAEEIAALLPGPGETHRYRRCGCRPRDGHRCTLEYGHPGPCGPIPSLAQRLAALVAERTAAAVEEARRDFARRIRALDDRWAQTCIDQVDEARREEREAYAALNDGVAIRREQMAATLPPGSVRDDCIQRAKDARTVAELLRTQDSGAGEAAAGQCRDCGVPLNDGEARCFTVCDACWAKAYPPKGTSASGSDSRPPAAGPVTAEEVLAELLVPVTARVSNEAHLQGQAARIAALVAERWAERERQAQDQIDVYASGEAEARREVIRLRAREAAVVQLVEAAERAWRGLADDCFEAVRRDLRAAIDAVKEGRS